MYSLLETSGFVKNSETKARTILLTFKGFTVLLLTDADLFPPIQQQPYFTNSTNPQVNYCTRIVSLIFFVKNRKVRVA